MRHCHVIFCTVIKIRRGHCLACTVISCQIFQPCHHDYNCGQAATLPTTKKKNELEKLRVTALLPTIEYTSLHFRLKETGFYRALVAPRGQEWGLGYVNKQDRWCWVRMFDGARGTWRLNVYAGFVSRRACVRWDEECDTTIWRLSSPVFHQTTRLQSIERR